MLKKNKTNILGEKVIVCSKGLKGAPPNTLKLFFFFLKNIFNFFLVNIHKKCILYQFKTFFTKYSGNKKERNYWLQGLQIVAFQQSFSQCWWKLPILERSLIKKPTSTMNLAPSLFLLSSLAYKLVNLLVLKKNHAKWARTELFSSIIGLGLNFTYEFEVCFSVNCKIK